MKSKEQLLRLRPAAGRRVRHPGGKLFADNGEPVQINPYYRRLLQAGDLEEVPAGKVASKPKPSSTEGSKTR